MAPSTSAARSSSLRPRTPRISRSARASSARAVQTPSTANAPSGATIKSANSRRRRSLTRVLAAPRSELEPFERVVGGFLLHRLALRAPVGGRVRHVAGLLLGAPHLRQEARVLVLVRDGVQLLGVLLQELLRA